VKAASHWRGSVALKYILYAGKYNTRKITLPKSGKDHKFPQNLRRISLLSTKEKLFEKVILKTVQRHIEERGLLNANQFGFRARHNTTL
jgi:hypothetical protein